MWFASRPCTLRLRLRLRLGIVFVLSGVMSAPAHGANATYRTTHFHFTLYDGLPASFAIPIGDAAEASYRRVLNNLGVTSSPEVTVRIYGDSERFLDVQEDVLGARIGLMGFARENRIYIDAPNATDIETLIVHEFVHVATWLVQTRGVDRWLAEAVAMYEAGQFVHPTTRPYLRAGQPPPSLAQLEATANTTQELYTLGYVLAEFIIRTWGRAKLIDLIKSETNFVAALGVTQAEFETQFATYLQQTYFVQPEEQFLTNTTELLARSVLKAPTAPDSWTFQLSENGQGTMAVEDGALVFRTTAITGTAWHVQAFQTGIAFEEGASYLVRFLVRSPEQASLQVVATINQPNYGTIGLGAPIVAGPEFTEHSIMFKATHVVPGNNRFGLLLGYGLGTVTVKDLAVARMQPPPPLPVIDRPPRPMIARRGGDAFFSAGTTARYATYQWRHDGVDLPGATAPHLFLTAVDPEDAGSYSVRVTNGSGSVESTAGTLTVAASGSAQLVNLSVRAQVGTGENILIPGFVVGGPGEPAQVLLRAVGPRLAELGVSGLLPDPALTLVPAGAAVAIAANDNWQDFSDPAALEAVQAQVGAFSLLDSTPEAALVISLSAGGYTAPTSDAGTGTGVALAEIYLVPAAATVPAASLVNLSARAQVGAGDNVLIPGFVIAGDTALTLLIRAVGPGLEQSHVTGVLRDPRFTVYRSLPGGGSEEVAGNDNWEDTASLPALLRATADTHAFPLAAGSADAALLLALNPGAYTVVVTGAADTSGVALVELYRVGMD